MSDKSESFKQSVKSILRASGARWLMAAIAEPVRAAHDRRISAGYLTNDAVSKKLHLGCGGNYLPGWLNTDYSRDSRRIRIDVTKRLPFADKTFDYVFSEHMIEHIEYAEARFMVSECQRVLKSGGTLRLVTPDMNFLMQLYQHPEAEMHARYIAWNSAQYIKEKAPHNALSVVNNYFRDWGHKYIYDESALAEVMRECGFRQVVRCSLLQSAHQELSGLENASREPEGFLAMESLVFEGTKP